MGLVQCIHSSLPTPRTAIREDRKRICVAPNATCTAAAGATRAELNCAASGRRACELFVFLCLTNIMPQSEILF